MNAIDRIVSAPVREVSTAVTAIVAGWFTLAFAVSLGGILVGA